MSPRRSKKKKNHRKRIDHVMTCTHTPPPPATTHRRHNLHTTSATRGREGKRNETARRTLLGQRIAGEVQGGQHTVLLQCGGQGGQPREVGAQIRELVARQVQVTQATHGRRTKKLCKTKAACTIPAHGAWNTATSARQPDAPTKAAATHPHSRSRDHPGPASAARRSCQTRQFRVQTQTRAC